MTLGNIPGYYYDTERKKYFKIQADHIAPSNAKYSRSNVKREQQDTKKRKKREQHESRLQKHTIPAARILRHSLLGGAGIRREHGGRPFPSYAIHRESAFVQGLRGSAIIVESDDFVKPRMTDALYVPEVSQTLLSVTHSPGFHCIYSHSHHSNQQRRQNLSGMRALHTFHDKILDMYHTTVRNQPMAIACTAQPNSSYGNVAVIPLQSGEEMLQAIHVISTGAYIDRLHDSKVNHETSKIAFAGTNGVRIYDLGLEMQTMSHFTALSPSTTFACEWIDPHTIAVGMRHSHGTPPDARAFHDVWLWDTRHDGISARVARKDRINSLCSPDPGGRNLLVGSSSEIALYDLRVLEHEVDFNNREAMDRLRQKPALLALEHTSQCPRLDLATYNGSFLAATDYHNQLQVYSLRTGRQLRTFTLDRGTTGLMSKPRWQEDHRGAPYLQVCAGNTIQQWSWDAPREEA